MGLDQAPERSGQAAAAPEKNTLRDSLPVETLAGTMDFTPRPTRVADMGAGAGTRQATDANQYLYFGNIYGQSVHGTDAVQQVADRQVAQAPAQARDTLLRSAETKITDPRQRAQFRADLQAFEQRAQTDNIDPAQVNQTFEQINRLLNAPRDTVAPRERTTQLAREVMAQAARPTDIAQGNNNTCNVTTVENLIYSRQPGVAAKLVADVAITGGYTAQDGTRVAFDRSQIKPDAEAQRTTRIDGERSYATQLFNQTAVNLSYQKTNPNIRYEIQPPLGERLMDHSRTPPQMMRDCHGRIQHPNLTDDQIVGVYGILSGRDTRDVYLAHRNAIDNDGRLLTPFGSQQELGNRLAELKANGRLPVIIAVNNAVEPFYTDGGGGSPTRFDGAHVVLVRDYQPGPPSRVAVDNQYTRNSDYLGNRMMDLRNLYLATLQTPDAIRHLQSEIADERTRGRPDPRKVAELRRLQQFTQPRQCSD